MVMAIFQGLLAAIGFYYLIWFLLLTVFLGTLTYEINSISPIHSESIEILRTIFTKHLYLIALFFAIATYLTFSQIELTEVEVPFVILGWTSITIQFIANRSTISKIVNKTKWKTLNKIQEQINNIQEDEDISDKDINEKLVRLVDTFEKIRITSASKFEIKSTLNFFSQMMLPLIGLILGNLDKLLDFLK